MTTTPQTEAQRLADEASVEFQCGALSVLTGRKMIDELLHLVAENSDLRERNAALGNAQEIALDTATEHALVADELRSALAAAEAERDQLARWKSTNAPRLEALEGLLADARAEAAKGAEAISSLASEREANAILTAENDQLRAQVERLQATEPFGYFHADPMGWTDCAATDEGAIALYERPAAPAVPEGWRDFLTELSNQKPEKPDYWSSCGQCERNSSTAEDLLAAAPATTSQPVPLTNEFIKEAAGQPEGYKFAAEGISKIDVWPHGGTWFPLYSLAQVQAIIAAMREKERV